MIIIEKLRSRVVLAEQLIFFFFYVVYYCNYYGTMVNGTLLYVAVEQKLIDHKLVMLQLFVVMKFSILMAFSGVHYLLRQQFLFMLNMNQWLRLQCFFTLL